MSNWLYISGFCAVPLISVICGLILWKAALGRNAFFGYRSKRSRKSELAWSFAQKTAGRLMVTVCAPMLPLSLAAGILAVEKLDGDGRFWSLIVLVAVQTAVMASVNFKTELGLKAHFDENGEPRQ